MKKSNLKKLFADLCCSNCGHDFDEDSIYILREEEGLFVLQVICPECQKSFGVAILGMESIAVKDKSDDKLPLQIKDLPEPISSDDVIDAHRFFKNLDDDWQKYIPDEYKS
ncbi:MAG: hypothetical protein K6C94_08215 [Candidatus Gastranaerophilales bacterium]|nr:hypothetical protein [Candidatus Gastranaerophilales bacterium]